MYNEDNNYCEVVITPEPPKALKTINILYIVLAVVTALLAIIISPLLFLVAALCLFLRNKMQKQANIELEYQFWGRQLDIEMVTGDEKRKQVATFQMDEVEIMAREDAPALEEYRGRMEGRAVKKMDLTDHDPYSSAVYVMYVRADQELLEVRLQPSREMLRKMWQVAFRTVRIPRELQQMAEEDL